MPRALRDAAKVELRRQGKTLRAAVLEALEAVVRAGPGWRQHLEGLGRHPLVRARGRPRKT